jgi:hypothetical protein
MTGKKATGRTKQLSLKATPEFHQRLKVLAGKEKCLMIEILEEALKLYEQVRKERKKAAKENAADKVSPVARDTVAKDTVKRPRDESGTVEESDTSSKKRKIDE